MSERVDLESDPVDQYDAATKRYVDSFGGNNYIALPEVDEPSPSSANTVNIFAADENGITVLNYVDEDGFVLQVGRDTVHNVKNTTGSTITAGSVVYINGST